MDRVGWENTAIPIVVVAEILAGRIDYLREAHRRAPRQLLIAFEKLHFGILIVNSYPIASFDEAALRVYRTDVFPGRMSRADRMIASIALAGGHTLVTRNVAHFAGISGLPIENWIDAPSP